MRTIDTHAHLWSDEYLDALKAWAPKTQKLREISAPPTARMIWKNGLP